MPDYERTQTVSADADEVFAFLSDVRNLPAFVPGVAHAARGDGDEVELTARPGPGRGPERAPTARGWMRVDRGDRRMEWGAGEASGYAGELRVGAGGRGSTVTVRLSTRREDPGVERSLAGALDAVRRLVEGGAA